MPQLVFIHGPGAGACADAYEYQLRHFPGSVAPNLPGHLEGMPCPDVRSYSEWLRGWLWAQGMQRDLLLVGFTLGASIALQYALDYPGEVAGVVAMTVALRPRERKPGSLELRINAANNPVDHGKWMDLMRRILVLVEPDLRERLVERHRQIGPLSQLHDLHTVDGFDVRDRIATLRPPLLLVRGLDDPLAPPDYEGEIHQAVPGSQYVALCGAGHFPATEKPAEVNRLIEEFMAGLLPARRG